METKGLQIISFHFCRPYCDGMDANMTSREKIAAILEKSKGGRLVTSKICKYMFATLGIQMIDWDRQ